MKVSGFTFVRNGVKYSYPFWEAINSILPLCDEMIINVGDSEDQTMDIIKSIKNDKVKILERVWDMSLRENGKLLSVETNHALKECTGDWCFYIQADEVVHEKYYPVILNAMKKYHSVDRIEGLRFFYKHFYGSHDYFQDNYRKWYFREVRVIKNRRGIVSWADAMGFKHEDGSEIKSADIKAEIYHYGWVRPPDRMHIKRNDFHKLYFSDDSKTNRFSSYETYSDLGNLKRFTEIHPKIMEERINCSQWNFDAKIDEQLPDWIRKIKILFEPVTKRIKRMFRKT